jgi:hypothetical protein
MNVISKTNEIVKKFIIQYFTYEIKSIFEFLEYNFLKQCKVFKFEIKMITILAKMMKLKTYEIYFKNS